MELKSLRTWVRRKSIFVKAWLWAVARMFGVPARHFDACSADFRYHDGFPRAFRSLITKHYGAGYKVFSF
jgi:hypothetical protein